MVTTTWSVLARPSASTPRLGTALSTSWNFSSSLNWLSSSRYGGRKVLPRLGERQRDHVPAATGQVGLVGPGAGQQREGAEIRVAGDGLLEVAALSLELGDLLG